MTSCAWIVKICFFFSSRRRHTRSYGDWSSDVCSSDLADGKTWTVVIQDLGNGNFEFKATTEGPGQFAQLKPEDVVLSVGDDARSEERRVGKECRSGWWPERFRNKRNVHHECLDEYEMR